MRTFAGRLSHSILFALSLALSSSACTAQYSFRKAREKDTIAAYKEFLSDYMSPQHSKLRVEAQDRIAYKEAQQIGTGNAFASYLRAFPFGLFRGEANANLHFREILNQETSYRTRLAQVAAFVEHNKHASSVHHSILSSLSKITFSKKNAVLVEEIEVSSGSLFGLIGADTYEVYAGRILEGEILAEIPGGRYRTLYKLTRTDWNKVLAGDIYYIRSRHSQLYADGEAFGSFPNGRHVDDTPPRAIPTSFGPTRYVKKTTEWTGVVSDVARELVQIAEENPLVATAAVTGALIALDSMDKSRSSSRSGFSASQARSRVGRCAESALVGHLADSAAETVLQDPTAQAALASALLQTYEEGNVSATQVARDTAVGTLRREAEKRDPRLRSVLSLGGLVFCLVK